MQRQKVKSSLLAAVGYDPETKVLEVEFLARQKEPVRRIYQYAGVTPDQFKEMVSDKSMGGYFLARIKPNHQCKRIEEELCNKCGEHKSQAEHTCPYKTEINDDEKTTCNCCETCEQNCADDI